jgi:N utilization substance protein B
MINATRRHGREWAIQMLFQFDLNPADELDKAIEHFWQQQVTSKTEVAEDQHAEPPDPALAPPQIRAFAERLARGVTAHRDEIDRRLAAYTSNWPLHRMGGIERNVLRLAIFEMFYQSDAPPVVCINEAVDLAKYFSSAESGRFVNGILDRACKDLNRPARH